MSSGSVRLNRKFETETIYKGCFHAADILFQFKLLETMYFTIALRNAVFEIYLANYRYGILKEI